VRQTAGTAPQSFQAILFRDGHLVLQYLSVQSPPPCVIGLENYDGTFAETVWCDGCGRPISAGDAVSLRPDLPW
jgi:hypothetical protein